MLNLKAQQKRQLLIISKSDLKAQQIFYAVEQELVAWENQAILRLVTDTCCGQIR